MRLRLHWLCAGLLMVAHGCQPLPSGSTAFLDLSKRWTGRDANTPREAPEAETVDSPEREHAPYQALRASQTAAETLQGPVWADDEQLRTIVERELRDASAAERFVWMNRLNRASPDDIPALLSERRRERERRSERLAHADAPAVSNPVVSLSMEPDQTLLDTQTILSDVAARPGYDVDRVPSPDASQHQRPLLAASAESAPPPIAPLAAPEPATASMVDEPPPPATDRRRRLMASVLGAFGMGGEPDSAAVTDSSDAQAEPALIAPAAALDPTPDEVTPATVDDLAPNPEPRTIETIYWQEELDRLIALLEAEVVSQQSTGEVTDEERDRYARQQIALRMLYLISSRRAEALQAIPALTPDEQAFWTRFFWALANYFDAEAFPTREERATQTLAQLTEAVRYLQPQADLQLRNVNFCHRIDGFGNYGMYDRDQFQPGQPALIYAEVRNFQSQLTAQGTYHTILKSTIEVFEGGPDGPRVFHTELPRTEDECRTRRRDYFHSYRIQCPHTLMRGPHVLRLTIRDELTGKVASETLPFLVR